MSNEKNIIDLAKKCRNSSFNRNNYCVNIDTANFIGSMLLHTWYDKFEERDDSYHKNCDDAELNKQWIDRVTPGFQRDNKKWNGKMKRKFIENILQGVKVEIMFFRMNEHDDAQIIDGLQRTTAILDFFTGKVKPFGFSYAELKDYLSAFVTHNLSIKIYTFDEWEEVGRFYIDMNENITHSTSDIQKAKEWFLNEHNIEL
ncbi:MAG TPA: DUF262 domain-containing protein [Arcobacter sp.]|nr:DUF262 domain-containing protein [Arcobacter sp.]